MGTIVNNIRCVESFAFEELGNANVVVLNSGLPLWLDIGARNVTEEDAYSYDENMIGKSFVISDNAF